MKFDISDMTAEVYTKNNKGVLYVKVTFPKLGMYINSITVRPSPKYPGELWVQMPALYVGRWIKVIEFEKDSQLHDLITDAVLLAVDAYNRDQHVPIDDTSDKDLLENINDIFPS